MPNNNPNEHFIPVSADDLIQDLLNTPGLSEAEEAGFLRFTSLFQGLYHQRFHHRLTGLRSAYQPFNPDTDTLPPKCNADERMRRLTELREGLEDLLIKSNYHAVDQEDLLEAMSHRSPEGVEVSVDLDDFEQLVLYGRGEYEKITHKRRWKVFGERQEIRTATYQRLFLLIKLKPEQQRCRELQEEKEQSEARARRHVHKSRSGMPEHIDDQKVILRLFRDVPKADLEMLFPNRRVRLRMLDKIRLAITGGGGTLSGIAATLTKITAAANPIAIASALGGLAAIIARQVGQLINQRTRYMMQLSTHLYFHTLNSNRGVIGHLLELAEEEESKEAILAWFFLCRAENGLSGLELDEAVEKWLTDQYGITVDFEIDDALSKLLPLGVASVKDGHYQAQPADAACERLLSQWQSLIGA